MGGRIFLSGRSGTGVQGKDGGFMENNVKVSVIVPSLNAAEGMEKCLGSIMGQSLGQIEIICVDAGSRDGTWELLERSAAEDKRIRPVRSKEKSYGYQVNLGIKMSRGEYIGIVEADDYITEDMYEILYENARESGADYVKANAYYTLTFGGEERRIRHGRNRIREGYYGRPVDVRKEPEAMLYSDYINIWDGIYSREFLNRKRIRLHETPGASYQDAGFAILCAAECERVMFLEDYLYCYRFDNGASSVKDQEKYRCTLEEFSWIREQLVLRGKTQEKYEVLYRSFLTDACCWNIHRLTRAYRRRFLEEMPAGFVKDYREDYFGEGDGFWKNFVLDICVGGMETPAVIDDYKRETKRGMDSLCAALLADRPLVLLGCPALWKSRWESVVETAEFLRPGAAWAMADNDEKKHGQAFCGKAVTGVGEAVQRYPGALFALPRVVCDERDGRARGRIPAVQAALRKQLSSFGIGKEQMDDTIYGLREFPVNIDILVGRSHVDEEE